MDNRRTGNCIGCGSETDVSKRWKSNWVICSSCYKKMIPYIYKKVPAGLIFKSQKRVKYICNFKEHYRMDATPYVNLLNFLRDNERLAADFKPTAVLCDGNFEYDEIRQLFRIYDSFGKYTPIMLVAEVRDFYVQDIYNTVDTGGFDDSNTTDVYKYSEICIEFNNPFVPFINFNFPFTYRMLGMVKDAKHKRIEEDNALAGILRRNTSNNRILRNPEYQSVPKFNKNPVKMNI